MIDFTRFYKKTYQSPVQVNDKIPIASRQNKTVILFGEILADVFPDRYVLGGAPFNVARHLKGFGLHPVLISRTGDDALRREILATMTGLGMDTQGLQTDLTHPTGQVLVHMENGGHHFEIVPEQAYDFIDTDMACETACTLQPELIYFGTLAQRHPFSRRALDALLANTSAVRLLDINLRKPWYDLEILKYSLTKADMLKLNLEELHLLGALLHPDILEITGKASALIKRFGLKNLLVTCGDAGAWLMNAEGHVIGTQIGRSLRIVDTVGAGDAFSAVFILGMFNKWNMETTLARADGFARAVCEIRGAVPKDDSFYEPFRTAWKPTNGGPR
jgi:fructokinase